MPSSVTALFVHRAWAGNLKTKWLAWRGRFLDQFQPLNLLELAHGLRGLGGNGAEAVGEFLERRDFLLLVFVGRHPVFVIGLALHQKLGIVAGVRNYLLL